MLTQTAGRPQLFEPFKFADLLEHYLNVYGYTPGQLAGLSGLPKSTIVNWLNGRVARPRTWQQLVLLAHAMRLTTAEINQLLRAANFPAVQRLRQSTNQVADQRLLAYWQEPVEAATTRPPFQVIPDLPYFVGRESLITEMRQALATSHHQTFYLIYGMAGVGKTVLAARIAYLCRANFPDGVLWLQVNTPEPMTALLTIAQAYGRDVRGFDTLSDRSRAVRELLSDKRALLILDDAENDEQLLPFLPPTGPCAVLVTSRRQDLFVLTGAKRWAVTPFAPNDVANQHLFARLLGEAAVRETAEPITTITHLLGGLPLALAIVASRLAYEPGWSPGQFAQRLQQTHQRLHELAQGEQTVRASFEISFALLTAPERHFFTVLGLFNADFSPEAAAQTTHLSLDQAQEQLRRLYRLSLLQVAQPGRFRLHPLLQDFAREQIANLPPQTPFSHYQIGFITYFISYLQAHRTDFVALQTEHENLLAALSLAAKIQPAVFIAGLKTIHDYLLIAGLFHIEQLFLEQALATPLAIEDQIDLFICQAQLNREQLDLSLARQQLEVIQPLIQNDTYREAAVLTELGICTALEGDQTKAIHHFEQGLELAQKEGSLNLLPTLFLEMGIVTCRLEKWAEAFACYRQGIEIAQAEKNRVVLVMLYKSLGALYLLQEDYDQGLSYLREGLEIARATLNFPGVVLTANNLAVAYLDLMEIDRAAVLLQEAMVLGQRFGNVKWLSVVEYNLALVAKLKGESLKEKAYFERALVMAQKLQLIPVMTHIQAITESHEFHIKAHSLVFL